MAIQTPYNLSKTKWMESLHSVRESLSQQILNGVWYIIIRQRNTSSVVQYTIQLTQTGSEVTGTCSNGLLVEGNLSVDGKFCFQTYSPSVSTTNYDCYMSDQRSLAGQWWNQSNQSRGTFELQREDPSTINNELESMKDALKSRIRSGFNHAEDASAEHLS